MSRLKNKKENESPPAPISLIIVGSIDAFPELAVVRQEVSTLVPNITISVYEPSKLPDALVNVRNNTYVLILTKTIPDLSLFSKIEVSKNNCIFYIDTPDKSPKYTKVSDKWEFYKLLLKKVQTKWEPQPKT